MRKGISVFKFKKHDDETLKARGFLTDNPKPGDTMSEYELWVRRGRGEDVSIYKMARPLRRSWFDRWFYGGH